MGQFRDLPDTKINKFMEALGSDVGGWKYAAIVACIACNVLFNDQFVATYLDKRTSAWGVVGLQVLYLIVENIDSYAALCFGNISQTLTEANPLLSLIAGLMFGQLYGSDLWVVAKSSIGLFITVCRGLFDLAGQAVECFKGLFECCSNSDCEMCCGVLVMAIIYGVAVAILVALAAITIVLIVGQIIPPIIDSFALPFIFFQFVLGIGEDSR